MPDLIDILAVGPLLPALQAQLDQQFRVHELWRAADAEALLAAHGDSIRAIVTTGIHGASGELIERLPKLGAICCFGVGVDAVDLETAARRAIQVSNTPDVLNECVADQALGLLLAVSRRIAEADRFVRAGRWENERFGLSTALGGKTCGILGMGPIGLAIARRAEAFGMRVAYSARSPKAALSYRYCESARALAAQSDVLILALPGGAATTAIVEASVLDALGPKGILINVARGSVVDEGALIDALVGNRLLGAGLDVFADEPRVPQALRNLDNVVLAPHIASGTIETRMAMAERVLENLQAYFQSGQVLHPVGAGGR